MSDARLLLISPLVLAPLMTILSAAIRLERDGPDDSDDDAAWELSDFVIATIIGPMRDLRPPPHTSRPNQSLHPSASPKQ